MFFPLDPLDPLDLFYYIRDFTPVLNRSPYQTSFSHFKRNTNRIQPKHIKKNKRKQQKLSRKINRMR